MPEDNKKFGNIAIVASNHPEAQEAAERLIARYGNVKPADAAAIVALGGDGLMLQTLHAHMNSRLPIYGMNRCSVGLLLNGYREDGLPERLAGGETTTSPPLRMQV